MNKKQQQDIFWSYWTNIALAVWMIVWDAALDGDKAMVPATYFIALAFIVHAHGNRIRSTILALNGEQK